MPKNNEFKLKVDTEICQGTAYCARVAPELFAVNQSSTADVIKANPGPEYEEQILEAATLCPTRAITY
tara:strand:+ start:30704 stop:30907 length:204 start_codon:yes stop_codon:yes gene_type:complete